MSKTRIFKKVNLHLSIVKEVVKPEQSETDNPNQIEVRNVPETVTEEVLKTYFEQARSGGSVNAVTDCIKIGPGLFRVTFHDPKGTYATAYTHASQYFSKQVNCSNLVTYVHVVAAQVMDKVSHKFKKAVLHLRFVHGGEHKYKPNQLAIHGLPESVEKDVIEVAIAGCLDMEEDDDFVLHVSGQSAIITFSKDYSTEGKEAI